MATKKKLSFDEQIEKLRQDRVKLDEKYAKDYQEASAKRETVTNKYNENRDRIRNEIDKIETQKKEAELKKVYDNVSVLLKFATTDEDKDLLNRLKKVGVKKFVEDGSTINVVIDGYA